MLHDEIRELLRELARATRATGASVVHGESVAHGEERAQEVRSVPLGHGAFLRIERSRPEASEDAVGADRALGVSSGDTRDDELAVAEAMERCARALRACARRWGEGRVPEGAVKDTAESREPAGDRIHARIRAFLEALARNQGADQVLVTLRRRVVAASTPPDPLHVERIPFITRRVEVEAERQGNSHAELAGDDFYAVSFWFGACLLAYFSAPYAHDFMRYRARMVTRELAPLLAMLDEPPPAPAGVAPIPE